MADTIRAFIAADIPGEVLAAIRDVGQAVRRCGFGIRWVPLGNIHLTLKFLGDTPRRDLGRVGEAMAESAARCPALSLRAAGLGVFPDMRRPRVLWVGLHGGIERLAAVRRHLDDLLAPMGVEREKRPFRGHLTIGRMKTRIESKKLADALQRLGDFESGVFTLDRIHLYQSELTPGGARYTRLSSAALAPRDADPAEK